MAPETFADILTARCGGVWVYLRYAIEELRSGDRRPGELAELPRGLWNYYVGQIRRWMEDPAWESALLPLIATLAAAGEPLSADALARFAGGLRSERVQRWCDSALRPLLSIAPPESAGGVRRYEVYHVSFREVFAVQPAKGWGDFPAALADKLRAAANDAHRRIAACYLDAFERLGEGPAEFDGRRRHQGRASPGGSAHRLGPVPARGAPSRCAGRRPRRERGGDGGDAQAVQKPPRDAGRHDLREPAPGRPEGNEP
jgi:hypothetical protein